MSETIEILSTKDQITEIKESLFWKDVARELSAWKKGFMLEMMCITDDAEKDNPSTASVLLHLGDLNGRIKAVDYLLGLPDMFIQLLEDKKK
jgi:hypothetical protein